MPRDGDFAALLDDLIAAARERSEEDDAVGAKPAEPYAYVADAPSIDDFWASVPGDVARSLYLDTVPTIATGSSAPEPELPSIDPADIARELQTASASHPRDLDRMRREFAFRNHPDRVQPYLRERAIQRMQVANMLIDKAKASMLRR